MGAHRRHEVGIRRAIEAAVGDDHAERGQHRKVPPEALAADRIEDRYRIVRFATDSLLEGDGFEPSVPQPRWTGGSDFAAG
jgi:hypothetical protein